jgi:DNA-binding NtrC family response regulator
MTSPLRKARILIVDDSRVICNVQGQMFDEMPQAEVVGYVDTASEAIAAIATKHPDCVLLDMQLKAGTGMDVLHAVHPVQPDLVFIVMSNNEGERFKHLSLRAGACHFIDKATELNKIRYVVDGLDLSRP